MIRCIIIEDEPLATDNLIQGLKTYGQVQIVHCFDDAVAGLNYASSHDIDVIFLDVHVGSQNGLSELKKKASTPPVIVVSANSQYAMQGFDLDVCDYLLKPYTFERLAKALDKFRTFHLNPKAAPASFVIKTDTRYETVFYKDLICIEGMGDYRRVVTHQHRWMTLQTFREFEEVLDPGQVLRIHKSYMIGLHALMEYRSGRVRLTNGQALPVSDTYRKTLKQALSNADDEKKGL
jgi:DNA-binding LytR/AlgR family response regulator